MQDIVINNPDFSILFGTYLASVDVETPHMVSKTTYQNLLGLLLVRVEVSNIQICWCFLMHALKLLIFVAFRIALLRTFEYVEVVLANE